MMIDYYNNRSEYYYIMIISSFVQHTVLSSFFGHSTVFIAQPTFVSLFLYCSDKRYKDVIEDVE